MDIFNQIQQFVGHDNEFFKGGLLLALFGFVSAYVRSLPRATLTFIQSRLVYRLRVDSDEQELYESLNKLLDSSRARVLTRSFRLVFDRHYRQNGKHASEAVHKRYNADLFIFMFAGHTYYVDFQEIRSQNGNTQFVYNISAYWQAKAAINQLLEAISSGVSGKSDDEIEVYARNFHNFQYGLSKKRSFNTLYYQPELIEDLLDDIQSFADNKDWYTRLGIPYRRGYLLYGEPGTGKTSLIKGLASHFDKPLYILNEAVISNGHLGAAFRDVNEGAMVVIEDFDRLFTKEKSKPESKSESFSMGDILNQLDGLESREGIMVFLTANHREVFDAALERPGRIDRKYYVSYMGWQGARKMFINFFGEPHLADFEQVWLDGLYTPAQLQVYFSKYKHQPQKAIENFGRILEEIGENVTESIGV